ncbi:MAG: universal stress protein, partial [Halofilum sp. (in: g-proteobacteria)]
MYEKILYPTDGSDGAEAALEHAIDHALRYDASLHVLYVIEETIPAMEAGAPDVLEALEERGEAVIDDVRERAKDAGVT